MAESSVSPWGYPPSRPFILLLVYFVTGTIQLSTVAARPPLPGTNTGAIWGLAAVSVVMVIAVAVAWARRAEAALPVLVALGIVIAALSALVAVGGQGQLVAGFYLAVLGMYSGYFLSARTVRVLVVLSTVLFGAALIANWRLDSPAYVLAVVVLVDGVTLIVSSLVQHLRTEAVHDPLTGVLNRRGLQDSATLVHDLDVRRNSVTSIVEIDLDGFKRFNDAHGHHAGDELLASIVTDWSTVLRHTDLLARTGGDEFVLILPATDPAEAESLITRMREANDYPWSAGIVTWRAGDALPAALREADEAMYRVKPGRRPE